MGLRLSGEAGSSFVLTVERELHAVRAPVLAESSVIFRRCWSLTVVLIRRRQGVRRLPQLTSCPPALRADPIVAATLHDIGCGHPVLGFHPLDGARFLAGLGFSPTVCHLVAHHSASTYEAEACGIDLGAYAEFAMDQEDLVRFTRCCGGRI